LGHVVSVSRQKVGEALYFGEVNRRAIDRMSNDLFDPLLLTSKCAKRPKKEERGDDDGGHKDKNIALVSSEKLEHVTLKKN
jgi:hypothetical protein